MVERKNQHPSAAPLLSYGGASPEEEGVLERLDRCEQLLRDSELQLGVFIENSPAAVAMFDSGMRYLTASPLWNARSGVDETPVGRSYYDVSPETSLAQREMHKRCLAGAVERSDAERLTRANGMVEWLEWGARPWRDGQGKIGGVVITLEDITERKEAGLAAAYLAAIVASSSDAILSKTLDGMVTSWNAGAESLFGYSAKEMIGQSIAVIIPADRIDEEMSLLKRMGAGERVDHCETVRVAKDGRCIDVSLTISPIIDAAGKVIGASKILRDITERKKGEVALRASQIALSRSQMHMRQAAGAAGLTFVAVDLASGRIDVAENFSAVMGHALKVDIEGWDQPETIERIMSSLFSHVVKADLPRVRAAFLNPLNGGPTNTIEYRVRDDCGGERWIEATWSVETGSDGKPRRIFSTRLDITKSVESRIELAAAKVEAERASETKSRFLAAASHDLRQPVQSLILLIALIKQQIADKRQIDHAVYLAEASVKSLNEMLMVLLDISRLDAGVVQPVMTSVDVGEMVRRLALEYQSRAFARGLSLRCRSRDFHVRTDSVLLERILRNLLENSLRYTSKGGVLIGLRQRGDSVRLEVVDTGIGIPADMQAKIFDEFQQIDNPGRDASKGLGLGLAIVSRLAGLLETEVQVSSRPGRGARFSLLLPMEEAAPVVVAMKAVADNPGGRLLVIEDDAGLREAYEMMLGFSGDQVFSAETGEKALAIAAREDWRFDAIVADQRLGAGLTGTATAKKICGQAGRTIPTMVVTGDTGKESLLEIYASGFMMLHKPVDADQLCGTLASLLSGARGLSL